ncbi:MAG: hypothetical protein AB1847_13725 [bacterium]
MERKKILIEKAPAPKSYEPPRIISEEVFETLALACCKSNTCLRYSLPKGLHGVS